MARRTLHCQRTWRRRVQQATLGHRCRSGDPLYGARRTLSTGAGLLAERQKTRLATLFDPAVHGDRHVEVEATWGIYRRTIGAYRAEGRAHGRRLMVDLIASIHGAAAC